METLSNTWMGKYKLSIRNINYFNEKLLLEIS